jgi:flagellar hook-associated protein FlgK
VGPDANGNMVVTEAGTTNPVSFNSGSLAAMLQDYNQTIPGVRSRLDGLANSLIGQLNQVNATGLGTAGPFTTTAGSVGVADPTAPLAAQNLPFPIQAGQLVVSVTNAATGNRTNATVAIDPATQSLSDVAAAITAATGGNVQAAVDPTTNALTFTAQPGFQFDFAGRDTNPPGGGAVANPDTANLLSGLGVNGLFTGSGAAGIAVNPAVTADPRLLAASRTGLPGDGTNLERMAAVRDTPAINGRTLGAEFTDLAGTVGADVQSLGDQRTSQAGVLQNLSAQEQSVGGVDTNEELVHLLDFQRMIEGASKYMSVVNTALDSIMNIIR